MPLPTSFQNALPAMSASAVASGTDTKALVVIYLGGGIDCHNFIIPRTGVNRTAYTGARSGVSIADNPATALNSELQFHPTATNIKALWDLGKVAVVSNVGPLIFPMTKTQYNNGTVSKPIQLFSHSDQNSLWQTGLAQNPTSITGWVGRMNDLLNPAFNPSSIVPPGITFAGVQAAFRSNETRAIGSGNSGLSTRSVVGGFRIRSQAVTVFNNMLATYNNLPNPMMREYVDAHNRANALRTVFNGAINSVSVSTTFPSPAFGSTNLGEQLKTVVKLAKAANTMNQRRQLFWLTQGGFDHHADLLTELTSRLSVLDPNVGAFYDALVEKGIENNVTLLIYSEFGRSLVQNGSGTDHAWGGHALVIGGAVAGGIYGSFPDLTLSGPNMVDSRGYLLPTTPTESLYSTLAQWLGVPDAFSNGVNPIDLMNPNLGNFPVRNLGFLG